MASEVRFVWKADLFDCGLVLAIAAERNGRRAARVVRLPLSAGWRREAMREIRAELS